MRFVVIRHGQSTNNLLWETTGSESGRHPDTPLTETGHRQAELTAGLLPEKVVGGLSMTDHDETHVAILSGT